MGESQRRWQAKQRLEREQIRQFKMEHPAEWQAMLTKAEQRKREEEEERQRAEIAWMEQQKREEVLRMEAARRQAEIERIARQAERRAATAMICRELPYVPELDKLPGKIALRQWDLSSDGWLTSNGFHHEPWQSQMIADRVPSMRNQNGLYCIEITADGLMTAAGGRVTEYCGLIELRGHLEYHEQERGIRAEWARIVCIFVLNHDKSVYGIYPQLADHYPGVPIFVTTREFVAKYLLRIAMWQETGDPTILYNTRV